MRSFVHAALSSGILLASVTAMAQERLVDDNCLPIRDCTPRKECSSIPRPTPNRDCSRCLVPNIFTGGCSQRGNDPVCEAQKGAEKAVADAEATAVKARCESSKASEKANCEVEKEKAKWSCEYSKLAAQQASNDAFDRLLIASAAESGAPLPTGVMDKLVDSKIYDRSFLKELSVKTNVSKTDIPTAFKAQDVGFTIGTTIFLLEGRAASALPLRFWLTQIEFSKFYVEYGLDNFYQALLTSREVMDRLINSKVMAICASLPGENPCAN